MGEPSNLIEEPKFLTPAMIGLINDTLAQRIDPLLAPMYYESSALVYAWLL